MTFLRHHGIPSPLLDWSECPLVASFFAFSEKKIFSKDRVAIYAFQEYTQGEAKIREDHAPAICGIGPVINTHERHKRQKSRYTICRKNNNGKTIFFSHEDIFQEPRQDILHKYIIPRSEKQNVLASLKKAGITRDSLLKT